MFTTAIQAIKRSEEDYVLTNVLLLTLSGKNIKKMGLTKYADFPCLWSNAWKYDVKLIQTKEKFKHVVKRSLYLGQNIII